MLPAHQSSAPASDQGVSRPVSDRLQPHRRRAGTVPPVRPRCPGQLPGTRRNRLRGVPGRNLLPQPQLSVRTRRVRRTGPHAPPVDRKALRAETMRLSQYRTDLQQRPGRGDRTPRRVQGHPDRRGRPYPGLPQPELRLPAPQHTQPQAAPEELPTQRRHRLSLLQPTVERVAPATRQVRPVD